MSAERERLDVRRFTLADQRGFAAVSGDHNPMHVEPSAARRLLFGELIVHGVHTLLWALDRHCRAAGGAPAELSASFHAPLRVGEEVTLFREVEPSGSVRLTAVCDQALVATFVLAGLVRTNSATPRPGRPPAGPCVEGSAGSLLEVTGTGTLPVLGATAASGQGSEPQLDFAHASAALGPLPVAALQTLSRLVGMVCPGRHSLLAGLSLRLDPADGRLELHHRVDRAGPPPAPVRLAVEGGGLRGSATAFVRPRPVTQPSLAAVAAAVPPGRFAGQRAVIIGGSRGLGELTAKIVAAGGGSVVVTYHQGADDAERVAAEINEGGGRCGAVALDVTASGPGLAALAAEAPTHLYYFAAPRLTRPRRRSFDAGLARELSELLVEAFGDVVTRLHARLCEARGAPYLLGVFYPSTTFVDELPREQGEYAQAKAAGELLCRHLARWSPGLSFVVRRLPPLPTDQTSRLVRRPLDDATPVLLEVVMAMHPVADGAPP